MSNHDIGFGARIENLAITTEFNEAAPKPQFDFFERVEVLNFGKPLDPKTFAVTGPVAMKAAAKFTAHGVNSNFEFGFKQAVLISGQSAIYAGIKDADGSILEGTSTLNGNFFLDVTADFDLSGRLVASHAPFYVPATTPTKNTESFDLGMVDHPGGSFQQKRRNSLKDRVNYLVRVSMASRFVTMLVVRRPDRSHLPIQGFSWTLNYSTDVRWQDGKPSIANPSIRVGFEEKIETLTDAAVKAILTNASLGVNDSMVKKANDAMRAVNVQFKTPSPPARIESQGYVIEQSPNYTSDARLALGLIRNSYD